MNRTYLALVLFVAVGFLACGAPSTNNTGTPSPYPTPAGSPTLGGTTNPVKFDEVRVTITIADDASDKPYISNVSPESADLTGGMRVEWVVDNQSKAAAGQNVTVDIGSFKGTADPNDDKPFGPDPCDNKFRLDFLKEGKQAREISEQAEFQTNEVAYQYVVTLLAEDGSELFRYKKMPEIIVGGLKGKPQASPQATPKPAPGVKRGT